MRRALALVATAGVAGLLISVALPRRAEPPAARSVSTVSLIPPISWRDYRDVETTTTAALEPLPAPPRPAANVSRGSPREARLAPLEPRKAPPLVSGAGEARALGETMAAERGWVGAEWTCLDDLWGRLESGWSVTARNGRSGAYGIPQALPASKLAGGLTDEDRATLTDEDPANDVDWRTSAAPQIRWGLGYVDGRYGTPCRARAVRLASGSY